MTRHCVPPLLALFALAACGRSSDVPGAPKVAETPMSNALLDPAREIARRWGTVFRDAGRRAQAARELGYMLAPMTSTGATPPYAGTSNVQTIVLRHSPVETRSVLSVSGARPDLADRYVFTFDARGDDGRDSKAAGDVDKTPLRVLMGFLQRFDVQPDDEIKVALKEFRPIAKALPGATITYDPGKPADQQRKRNRRSIVTIVRPGVPRWVEAGK